MGTIRSAPTPSSVGGDVDIRDRSSEVLCFVGSPDGATVCACHYREALDALGDPQKTVWINFLAPNEDHLAEVVSKLGFHELAVEDVFSARSRAKVEEYPGHLFCVVPALNLNPGADALDIINLNAFLGRNYLISAQRAPIASVNRIREEMERGDPPLLRGADFVFYRLLDGVADEYLSATDRISEQLDGVEDRIFAKFDPQVSSAIFSLKHEAAWLRRRVAPQRGMINTLTNRSHELISPETQVYLRDVHDHIHRVSDNLDTFHDLLQSALDVYLALSASRTNQVMKFLSIVGAIVLPLNVLTGLYGTNFVHLPGSEHPHGFWVFSAVLASAALSAILLVRSRKWL